MIDGKEWNSEDAILETSMPAGLCHNNSIDMWLQKDDMKICTGYSLNNNQWIRHTWTIDSNGTLHECTPIKREKYFGVILNDKEAELFRRDYDFEYNAKCTREENMNLETGTPMISVKDIGKKTLNAQHSTEDKKSILSVIMKSITKFKEVLRND